MDTSEKRRLLQINNQIKKIEAYLNDERASQLNFAEVYNECEDIKVLLKQIKMYTKKKCKLERGLVQDKCKYKPIQNLQKIVDEDKKRHSELQISVKQEEKKKLQLSTQYQKMKMLSERLQITHRYYTKENIEKELTMLTKEFEELSNKKKQALNVLDELQRELDEINPFHSIMRKEAKDEAEGDNPQNNKTSKQ